jgi:hypothetical protein
VHVEREQTAGAAVRQLVGGHDPRPEGVGEVLALHRAQAGRPGGALEIPRGPVVEQGVAGDVVGRLLRGQIRARPADDGGQLELEVQVRAPGRNGDRLVRPTHRVRVGEVEVGRVVPGGGRFRDAEHRQAPLEMLLEGQEVPDGPGADGREQADLAQRQRRAVAGLLGQACPLLRRGDEQLVHRDGDGLDPVVVDDGRPGVAVEIDAGDLHEDPPISQSAIRPNCSCRLARGRAGSSSS